MTRPGGQRSPKPFKAGSNPVTLAISNDEKVEEVVKALDRPIKYEYYAIEWLKHELKRITR